MKMKYIILGIIAVVLLTLILIIFIIPKKSYKKLEGIKYLRFTYTTGYHMNASVEYEIVLKNDKYTVSIKPTDLSEEDAQVIEVSKELVKEIEDKLNEYNVGNWDGFHKFNKNVLDGDSFSMSIKLEDDKEISASGYMMWPNNYREVRGYLDSVLGSLYKK